MARSAEVAGPTAPRPRIPLALLIAAQVGGVVAFALTAPVHNDWLWYQGGDQIWLATTSELLASLHIAPALVGYGWPLVISPVMGVAGPDYVSALPALVVLGVMLSAVCTLLVYLLGELVGGRALGLVAATTWAASPFVSLLLFADRYHDRWVDQFLPQFLGLGAMADLPSTALTLLAAYLLLRALRSADDNAALLAGLVTGFAAATKPSTLVFLLGPVLAVLLAWRFRPAVLFAAASVPSLVLLTLWKQRGQGEIPLFALEQSQMAAGSGLPAATFSLERYMDVDWSVLAKNISDIEGVVTGAHVLEWLPLVGLLVVARLSLPAAGLLGGWLLSYLVVKGANARATVDSGSFFRLLMPAWPAYVILVAAAPFALALVLRRGVAPLRRPCRPVGRRPVVAVAVLTLAVPLLLVVVSRPVSGTDRVVLVNNLPAPVSDRLAVRVDREPSGRTTISWREQDLPARVYYRVYRWTPDDTRCDTKGADECQYLGEILASTHELSHVDGSPPEGTVYRVGIGANAQDDANAGDVFLISPQAG